MSVAAWILAYLLVATLTALVCVGLSTRLHADEWVETALVSLVWPIMPVLVPAARAFHRYRWKKGRR